MKKNLVIVSAALAAGVVFGCSGDDSSSQPSGDGGAGSTSDATLPTPAACTTIVKDADCDKSLRPFVFVHGTYGSGDNFAHVAALLASNGYCPDRIVGVEYNSLGDSPGNDCTGANTPAGCGKIDAVINQVLQANPQFTQVDFGGHSQGTSHCGTYLQTHANKIAHYINFSGTPDVGTTQTLSLSSLHDLGGHPNHATGASICASKTLAPDGGVTVTPASGVTVADVTVDAGVSDASVSDAAAAPADAGPPAACNVKQVTFTNQDHFAVAASKDSFIQVYKYLTGKDPQYTTIQCGDDPVTIAGIAEAFADNVPGTGRIELRPVGAARATGTPEQVITPTADGHFGPVTIKRGVYYEFAGYDAKGALIGYSYFTPFKRSNYLVRMLVPASSADGIVGAAVAAQSTGHIVRGPNHVAIVARWAGGAFRQDLGASLKIDDNEVLTDANSGNGALSNLALAGGVVGLFMYDANKNGVSDLGLVTSGPFLSFTDVFLDAKTPALDTLKLTPGSEEPETVDNTVVISNWPSDGALVNVFFQ